MKLKIGWEDFITLLLFLCCVISLLVENLYIKWAFIIAETVITLISSVAILIITFNNICAMVCSNII